MDSWGSSHDEGEWIRPGAAGQSGSRREGRPEDPYDDGSYVRAVPRDEPPPGRRPVGREADPDGPRGRDQHFDDHFEDPVPRGPAREAPRHDTYDGYGYGDDDQYAQGYAAPDAYPYATHGRDATHGGGGNSPFATGWLPLWPTVGIALAAVVLAFIIGHVTAGGGGSNTVASTPTTAASTTTTAAAPVANVTVQRGNTLSAIASQNGIDLQTLATYNNIAAPYVVFVGEVIHIPPKTP